MDVVETVFAFEDDFEVVVLVELVVFFVDDVLETLGVDTDEVDRFLTVVVDFVKRAEVQVVPLLFGCVFVDAFPIVAAFLSWVICV
ncbi:MAG: hypothetical protein WCJ81_05445 [bacterium]